MKEDVEVCRFCDRTVLPTGGHQTTQGVPAMIRVLMASALCFILLAPSLGHSAVVTEEEALTIGENFIEFMIDARGPRAWRKLVPVVCSPRQIMWVVGWRIDDRLKVTASTGEVLRLRFRRLPDDG